MTGVEPAGRGRDGELRMLLLWGGAYETGREAVGSLASAREVWMLCRDFQPRTLSSLPTGVKNVGAFEVSLG